MFFIEIIRWMSCFRNGKAQTGMPSYRRYLVSVITLGIIVFAQNEQLREQQRRNSDGTKAAFPSSPWPAIKLNRNWRH